MLQRYLKSAHSHSCISTLGSYVTLPFLDITFLKIILDNYRVISIQKSRMPLSPLKQMYSDEYFEAVSSIFIVKYQRHYCVYWNLSPDHLLRKNKFGREA